MFGQPLLLFFFYHFCSITIEGIQSINIFSIPFYQNEHGKISISLVEHIIPLYPTQNCCYYSGQTKVEAKINMSWIFFECFQILKSDEVFIYKKTFVPLLLQCTLENLLPLGVVLEAATAQVVLSFHVLHPSAP